MRKAISCAVLCLILITAGCRDKVRENAGRINEQEEIVNEIRVLSNGAGKNKKHVERKTVGEEASHDVSDAGECGAGNVCEYRTGETSVFENSVNARTLAGMKEDTKTIDKKEIAENENINKGMSVEKYRAESNAGREEKRKAVEAIEKAKREILDAEKKGADKYAPEELNGAREKLKNAVKELNR